MGTFEFTLVISGADEEGLEDRLFEAGCDDALVSMVRGATLIDFNREAETFTDALSSAIGNVRKAGFEVVRIEPDDYVNASDIASRAGMTRQAISLLIQGKRGPGNFPRPVARISSETPLWDWYSVAKWLNDIGRLADPTQISNAGIVRELNIALASMQSPASEHASKILQGSQAAD